MAGAVLSSCSLSKDMVKRGEEKVQPSKECHYSGWMGSTVGKLSGKDTKQGLGEKPWRDTGMRQ